MGDIREQLDELERLLGTSVGDAFEAALQVEVPGGSTPAWLEVLSRHQLEPSSEESRLRAAQATGQLFGAPPDELDSVLQTICQGAKARLDKLDWQDEGGNSGRVQRIFGVIDRAPKETLTAYRKKVMPARRSMFAGAMASAAQSAGTPKAEKSAGKTFIMRCSKCGAPRLKEDDFTCEYCDTPYAEQ